MKIERIAFRFQKDEMQVLMRLLGIEALPGVELDAVADEARALQGLIEDGIVQAAGAETMLVDRAVSLTLLNAAAHECCAMVESERARATLFRGRLFDVIVSANESMHSLCPIREWEQACRQFLQEAERMQAVRFAFLEKGADLKWEDAPQDELTEILRQRLSQYSGREG